MAKADYNHDDSWLSSRQKIRLWSSTGVNWDDYKVIKRGGNMVCMRRDEIPVPGTACFEAHCQPPSPTQMRGVYIEKLRLMAPQNPLVRSHEAKQARIDCLQEEILFLRVEISQRQKLVNGKAKELRHLAPDYTFLFYAFSP
ncbi:hypothetical protein B0H65DRAFT_553616 [Neurospora tetraspora]|uniref:Uncharacterized protein n=1 Tax=Neurospora tetraspora TaxID=94610 RepID=A0AAE0J0G3_9PEZI|nr:hypothetical protein B0H65DRAFT_553616 [Neurospora tetraspora]